jgi:hypothetical protein
MGRPELDIDPRQVELLASAFCTNEEIAAKLGCSSDTLTRRYAESLQKGRDNAKASLRVKQWEVARKGNVPMLIWLGKQYLGQRDKRDLHITDTDKELDEALSGLAPDGSTSTSPEDTPEPERGSETGTDGVHTDPDGSQ